MTIEEKIIDTYTYYLIIEYRNGSVNTIDKSRDYDRAKSMFDSIIEEQEESGITNVTYRLIKVSPEFI